MLAGWENARCYALRRPRALPVLRSLRRLSSLRLPFFHPDLLSAQRNPVLPPEEIDRGMVTGTWGVRLTRVLKNGVSNGIGPPDNGVAKPVRMKVFFLSNECILLPAHL